MSKATKERILEAAEELFAERGFEATSLRTITARAEVNLAAVNYHFGTKESLIEQVLSRRIGPLNRERLERLEALEREAGGGTPRVVDLVDAFVGPALRMSRDPAGMRFMRLFGHTLSQRDDRIRSMFAGQFQSVARRFAATLARALPHLTVETVFWRMMFMVGAMAHTMALSDKLPEISGGACRHEDVEHTIRRLVPFLAAGLAAPAEQEPTRETEEVRREA